MSAYSPVPITTCGHCGAELAPGARYCANCGQPAGSDTPGSAAPSPPSASSDDLSALPNYRYAGRSERGGIGRLFSGAGRIGRLEWFLTVLGIWLVLIVSWGIIIAVDAPVVTIVLGFGSLALTVIVAVCAGVKRLHDFGQSGWLYLLMLVPFASFILFVVLLVIGPNPGRNIYGFEDSGSVMR